MDRDSPQHIQQGFSVRGRVQGVGFRCWTQRKGAAFGLAGTVRNLPDATVEVHASGPAEILEKFEVELATGPSAAYVDRVVRLASKHSLPPNFVIE